MSSKFQHQINVRLCSDWMQRTEALIPWLSENDAYVALIGGDMKVSQIVRLAILKGIESMEEERGDANA